MNEIDILFDRIRSFCSNGENINDYFESKAVLYELLDIYYRIVIYRMGAYDYEDDWHISEQLLCPLNERECKIGEYVNWLIENGATLNDLDDYQPLIPPVAFLDYYMVELLLSKGVSPHLDGSGDEEIPYGCGNYYIDDLDVNALNYSSEPNEKEVAFAQILKIAQLFARYGVADVNTYCISIDSKTRMVTVTQVKIKY